MKNLSDKQQAELGAAVAELKTLLHDTENKITNRQVTSVDWQDVFTKVEALGTRILTLINVDGAPPRPPTPERVPESVPAPTPAPTPKKAPDPRRK